MQLSRTNHRSAVGSRPVALPRCSHIGRRAIAAPQARGGSPLAQARSEAQETAGDAGVEGPCCRRKALGLLGGVAAVLVASSVVSEPALAQPETTTFLKSTGARGVLPQAEEDAYRLRLEKETEAIERLRAERLELERMNQMTQEGKLCATPFGVDVVGITETVALVGALVGGVAAGKRKREVDKLNEQLRKINMQLRQQARAGTMYAPGLTYAPRADPGPTAVAAAAAAVADVPAPPQVAPPAKATTKRTPKGVMVSVSLEEEEMTVDQIACRDALKEGKRLLKERNGPSAMVRFEKALMLSQALGDLVQRRRAYRGLAAASRLNKQYTTAIKYLERVLEVSREMNEFTGDADAFGTIADCYTDMGEFEKAAQFYDKYIAAMSNDGQLV